MQPRTLALSIVAILGGAVGFRFLNDHYGWLPMSEEAVLRRAVAISVTFKHQDRFKTLVFSDTNEVKDLVADLHVNDERFLHYAQRRGKQNVEFHLPNGDRRYFSFDAPMDLNGFLLHREFWEKLNGYVSKREGRDIDLMELWH